MKDDPTTRVPDKTIYIVNVQVPPIDSASNSVSSMGSSVSPHRQILKDGLIQIIGEGTNGVKSATMNHLPMLSLHSHQPESRGASEVWRISRMGLGS